MPRRVTSRSGWVRVGDSLCNLGESAYFHCLCRPPPGACTALQTDSLTGKPALTQPSGRFRRRQSDTIRHEFTIRTYTYHLHTIRPFISASETFIWFLTP